MAHFALVIRKYLDDPSHTNKDIKKLSDDNKESSILDDMDDFENLESPDIDDELTDSFLMSLLVRDGSSRYFLITNAKCAIFNSRRIYK